MKTFQVTADTTIDVPAALARAQFGDVVHHATAHPHRRVRFEVIDDGAQRCRYRQITRVGPLRLAQELELLRCDSGPLLNRVIKGQFAGGTISFVIEPVDEARCSVTASVDATLSGPHRIVAPLLRRTVRSALVRALAEDAHDLESGRYEPGRTDAA